MNKRITRALCLLLAMLMAFSFAGCKVTEAPKETTAATTAETTAATTEATTSATTAETTTAATTTETTAATTAPGELTPTAEKLTGVVNSGFGKLDTAVGEVSDGIANPGSNELNVSGGIYGGLTVAELPEPYATLLSDFNASVSVLNGAEGGQALIDVAKLGYDNSALKLNLQLSDSGEVYITVPGLVDGAIRISDISSLLGVAENDMSGSTAGSLLGDVEGSGELMNALYAFIKEFSEKLIELVPGECWSETTSDQTAGSLSYTVAEYTLDISAEQLIDLAKALSAYLQESDAFAAVAKEYAIFAIQREGEEPTDELVAATVSDIMQTAISLGEFEVSDEVPALSVKAEIINDTALSALTISMVSADGGADLSFEYSDTTVFAPEGELSAELIGVSNGETIFDIYFNKSADTIDKSYDNKAELKIKVGDSTYGYTDIGFSMEYSMAEGSFNGAGQITYDDNMYTFMADVRLVCGMAETGYSITASISNIDLSQVSADDVVTLVSGSITAGLDFHDYDASQLLAIPETATDIETIMNDSNASQQLAMALMQNPAIAAIANALTQPAE